MSEGNGYATADAFKQASECRLAETAEREVPGVGKILIGRLNGRQAAAIKASMQARILAIRDGRSPSIKHDESIEYILHGLLNPETKRPMFTESDRAAIAGWDGGLIEHVAGTIAEFNDVEETTEKN